MSVMGTGGKIRISDAIDQDLVVWVASLCTCRENMQTQANAFMTASTVR